MSDATSTTLGEQDDVSRDARDMLFGGIFLIMTLSVAFWLIYIAREEQNWITLPLIQVGLLLVLPLQPRSATRAFGVAFAWMLFAGLIGHVLYDELWAGATREQQSWFNYAVVAAAFGSVGLSIRHMVRERRARTA